jgi:hypothetical protein
MRRFVNTIANLGIIAIFWYLGAVIIFFMMRISWITAGMILHAIGASR